MSQPEPNAQVDAIAAEMRWQSRCLSVLTTIAIGLGLYVLRPVLAPFVVAVFATVGLKPILEVLQRRLGVGRATAVAVSFVLGVLLVAMLSGAIASSIQTLSKDSAFRESAVVAGERVARAAEWLGVLSDPPQEEPASPQDAGREPPAGAPTNEAERAPAGSATNESAGKAARFGQLASAAAKSLRESLLGGMVAISGSMGVVLVYMFFLLLGASDVQTPRSELWQVIESKLREYLILKTVISLVTGLAVWLVLAVFGVPLALLMGLLTFLLNYVPNFGPLITCLLPLPLIWLSPDLSLMAMLIASVLACGVQVLGGNVIEPRLMGSSFDLHPIVVLLALMLWYALWGFVGMLLAVPMTAALKVVLGRIERTEPVARVLAGDLSALPLGRA